MFIFSISRKENERKKKKTREKEGCCCCLVTKSVMSDSCDSVGSSLPASSVCGLSQQEYWSRLPFPSPGDLPDPGIKPMSPTLQTDCLPLSHWGSLQGGWKWKSLSYVWLLAIPWTLESMEFFRFLTQGSNPEGG